MTTVTWPAGAVRHPWNEQFAWVLPATPPRSLDSSQKEAFDRNGFFVLPHVVDAELLAELTTQLDHYEARVDEFLAGQEGERMIIAERGAP